VTLNEQAHADRARRLREAFPGHNSVENLAEFLHQQYRATAKAMIRAHDLLHASNFVPYRALAHDHGWGDCYGKKKEYFKRRARWLLTNRPSSNGGFPVRLHLHRQARP
jgi:hypothetical protein